MGAPDRARFFYSFHRESDIVETLTRSALALRCADPFDAAALAELRVASVIEMGLLRPDDAPAFARRCRRELWDALRDDRLAAWLLAVDGRVEGCACVLFWNRLPYPGTSLHAEVSGVYVAPAYRRRGIARELVRETIAAARARGARRIVLNSTDEMRAFYRDLGFADSGQLRLDG
jgi:GNAT superfamily N-acetyltransferase